MSDPHIHCPLCAWVPQADSRWVCTRPGCGTEWNTFWTRGVCPGCGYQWRNTDCLACLEMSPHEAWYHWPEGGEREEEAAAPLEETIEVRR